MQLVQIERGIITIKLDFTDCYAIADALEQTSGELAGPSGLRFQVYEAMGIAFRAAAAVGHLHCKVDGDALTLEALQAEYRQKRENI